MKKARTGAKRSKVGTATKWIRGIKELIAARKRIAKQKKRAFFKASFLETIRRKAGTERAFSGPLNFIKDKGTYVCAGCKAPLYESKYKFDSGTGWPCFFDVEDKKYVSFIEDNRYGMERIEVICSKCEGHLGHIFNDGPKPTGKRYCNNGVCLVFKPKSWKVIHSPNKCFDYN